MRGLVTGASGGIGKATARRLAGHGWDLALHANAHPEVAAVLAEEFGGMGREAFPLTADLADPRAPAALAREVGRRWDSLDLLVLNAGEYARQPFRQISDDDLLRALRINFTSGFSIVRELLPALERSRAGRIVFVTSVLAFSGSSHGAHYASAKAALLGLSRSLARELAPAITVNAVAPGSIDTAILSGDTPEQRRRRNATIPLGRIGLPEEVAGAIEFLASPEASYITGATIHVNGGLRCD
ncbi:MAG TPA: SDR family oxidoreductase [Thermoplasmata archaeon]|nr:SDR family oxidoreductase [Thermoplasmata archaeon]